MNTSEYLHLQKMLSAGPGKIVLLSHRNPDGDAIGSSLALYNLFLKLGHQVEIILPNAFPSFLKWMKNAGKIRIYERELQKSDRILNEADIIFALDFNELSRVKEFNSKLNASAYKILIDHHPSPENFTDLILSDISVSSTAELVYRFIKETGFESLIDKDIASCIYAGIMTDTGCFSYNSSAPETFKIVAELLARGIDKDQIYDNVYNNYSDGRMRLMGYCLDKKMQYLPEFNTSYIALTQEELRNYNFKIGDSEGFVNLPLSIKGIRFSVLLIENKENIRLSFRSKGNFAVNKFASENFHGGGHKNAAGGESYESLEKTVDNFLKILPLYKDELVS